MTLSTTIQGWIRIQLQHSIFYVALIETAIYLGLICFFVFPFCFGVTFGASFIRTDNLFTFITITSVTLGKHLRNPNLLRQTGLIGLKSGLLFAVLFVFQAAYFICGFQSSIWYIAPLLKILQF